MPDHPPCFNPFFNTSLDHKDLHKRFSAWSYQIWAEVWVNLNGPILLTLAAEIQVNAGFPKLEWNANLCQHNWVQVNKAKSKNGGGVTNVLLKMKGWKSSPQGPWSSRVLCPPGQFSPRWVGTQVRLDYLVGQKTPFGCDGHWGPGSNTLRKKTGF